MKRKFVVTAIGAAAFGLLPATPAMAQEVSEAAAVQAVLDNIWVFIAGILVFLMQAGFALVESGLTRAKHIANIMAKNLADMAIGVAKQIVGRELKAEDHQELIRQSLDRLPSNN